jgi:hypothetical protein
VQGAYEAHRAGSARKIIGGTTQIWSTPQYGNWQFLYFSILHTSILVVALAYMDHLIQEATEIWLHHRNFDRSRGLISVSPGTVTKMIKEYCENPIWR